MKKKTHKDFINWIHEQVLFYGKPLNVSNQRIKVEFNDKTSFLEITCTYPYLEPTIRFSDSAFKEWAEGKMERDRILHELCHMITDPLYSKAVDRYVGKNEIEDERERLTDTMTVIIRNLYG